jgi:Type I phosphodiesterase / nucleotide pyrophosphatase
VRRAKVMPFLWNRLVAQQGFIAGNRTLGSRMQVANTLKFSYPGYSELLTGAPHDDVITSNDNNRYPFLTVLEWLRADLKLPREGIATFGSWETFNYIAEREEGAITINAGYEDFVHPDPEMKTLSALQHLTPNGFHGARHDIYTFRFGLAHLQTARPRVLYLAFDETDDWAHLKRYDLVLDTLHRTDRQLEQLWTWLQSDPEYRGTTTLILTVDHGRGRTPADWTDHGAKVAGAEETWIGCFGPAVTARGESREAGPLYQRQVAGTVAALVGRNFQAAVPGAAAPIAACTGAR